MLSQKARRKRYGLSRVSRGMRKRNILRGSQMRSLKKPF
jgi:hypothetical protein